MSTRTSHLTLVLAFATMAAGLAFELLRALTGVGGPALDSLTSNWVYMAVELIAVGVCASRALTRRSLRGAWILMTAALACWSVGDLLWAAWLDGLARPPFPSPADGAYLLMYPLMYGALMVMIRSRLRTAATAQWLDGGVLALAVSAVAATLVFSTVLARTNGRFVPNAVTIAYPTGDLILLMFVALGVALTRGRVGRAWLVLGGGLVLMASADIIDVDRVAGGMYISGALLNVVYLASFTLLAVAAWVPAHVTRAPRDAPHTIGATAVAAAVALGVLILAAFVRITPVAVGLAAGALVLASVRSGLTYRENVGMLRARSREATRDSLTGLPNRRQLICDLDDALRDGCSAQGWTLAFFDLDGFKAYNDTFGHLAGDALLARLGAALENVVGSAGHAYRLGGDEFCALLAGRHAREHGLIVRMVGALSERGQGFDIGTSVGLAVLPDETGGADAALQLADKRMYADKGRAQRSQTRDVLMQLLSERMPGLHEHSSDVTRLVAAVAAELELDSEQLDEALRAAELHDVGKLAIPDAIINKPGPLNDREWQFMRQHPIIGERILGAAPALAPVAMLVRASHERWDGGGYPDGLAGEQIPLGARIVTVCDAYDAIVSERCYQRARSPAEAIAELRRNSGSQFDPIVVHAIQRAMQTLEMLHAERTLS